MRCKLITLQQVPRLRALRHQPLAQQLLHRLLHPQALQRQPSSQALPAASGAAVLLDMARSLWLRFGPSLRVVSARNGAAALPDAHKEALAAMRAGDPAALARAMERDIAQGVDQVRAALARGEI